MAVPAARLQDEQRVGRGGAETGFDQFNAAGQLNKGVNVHVQKKGHDEKVERARVFAVVANGPVVRDDGFFFSFFSYFSMVAHFVLVRETQRNVVHVLLRHARVVSVDHSAQLGKVVRVVGAVVLHPFEQFGVKVANLMPQQGSPFFGLGLVRIHQVVDRVKQAIAASPIFYDSKVGAQFSPVFKRNAIHVIII